MKMKRCMGAVLAAAMMTTLGGTRADAIKFYRDLETGQIYGSPGENREEYKPFGLDIGFQFFLQYSAEIEDRNQPAGTAYAAKTTATRPYDAFAATRTVVDFRRSFTPNTRARLVLDNRGSGNDYRIYVRHVYGEFDFPSLASQLQAGVPSNPVTSYDDSFWGYRVQGSSYTEREQFFANSADWGLQWRTKFTAVPLTWTSLFVNGEGRTTAEVNSGKMALTHLALDLPMITKGLTLTGAYSYAYGGTTAWPNTGVGARQSRLHAGLFLKKDIWRIGATYLYAWDEANNYANAITLIGNGVQNMNRQSMPTGGYALNEIQSRGYNVMGVVDIPGTEWSLMARYDWLQPGTFYRDNDHSRIIAGAAYRVNDNVTVLANYESLDFKNRAELASGNITANAFDQSRVYIQSEIKF